MFLHLAFSFTNSRFPIEVRVTIKFNPRILKKQTKPKQKNYLSVTPATTIIHSRKKQTNKQILIFYFLNKTNFLFGRKNNNNDI